MITAIPERKIEMVHLQLTARCNLNCWFCGQRKKDWKNCKKEELSLSEWMKIVQWLEEQSVITGRKPVVMIWGGEAILSPAFEPVVHKLHEYGFRLGMVTYGTLLGKNLEFINENFEKLYVSVDGDEQEHDAIRGKGVYRKIQENLSLLKPNGPKKILMMVLTERTVLHLRDILEGFQELQPDLVILQDMIFLEREEVECYKNWLREDFEQEAMEINAWLGSEKDRRLRDEASRKCKEEIKELKLSYELQYLPHISETNQGYCLSPFRHIHISWNGQVSFCTDFSDFSCGSVREEKPDVLFGNQRAEMFRKAVMEGKCVTCRHCSWRYRDSFLEL